MAWLKRIERRLEPFAIPHLTLYLVIGQTFVYLAIFLNLLDPMKVVFAPTLVMHGQVWRLVTFLFFPPMAHWALIAFGLYFLYFTGNTLEGYWGTVRYNLFILTGYLLTVGVAFLTPDVIATNVFIGGSIFLAFAYLNPDFVMYVFLVLPVKMRWMAILAWAGYAWEFFTGGPAAKLAVLAATGNFLLFFGRDIWLDIRAGRRRMQAQARRITPTEEDQAPRHKCYVCGRNSNDEPRLDFRYCSKCAGDQCYCPDHIHNHVHVLTTDEPPKS